MKALILAAFLGIAYNAVGQESQWTFCANENETCSFPGGTKQIRYGANGKYNMRTGDSGVLCIGPVFGDPAPGIVKHCEYADLLPSAGPKPWHTERDSQNKPVLVVDDPKALDQMLRKMIFDMRDALAHGDINGACSFFVIKNRAYWCDRFSRPRPGFDYASVATWFTDLVQTFQYGPLAFYEMTAGTRSGSIAVQIDEDGSKDGTWRISGF